MHRFRLINSGVYNSYKVITWNSDCFFFLMNYMLLWDQMVTRAAWPRESCNPSPLQPFFYFERWGGNCQYLVMMQDDLEGIELGGRNQHSIHGFREPISCPFQSFFNLLFFYPKMCVFTGNPSAQGRVGTFLCAGWVMSLSDPTRSLPVGVTVTFSGKIP